MQGDSSIGQDVSSKERLVAYVTSQILAPYYNYYHHHHDHHHLLIKGIFIRNF